MKRKLLIAIALVLGLSAVASAQVLDTVWLEIRNGEDATGIIDGTFVLDIKCTLSDNLSGGTLGFKWTDPTNWKCDSIVNGPVVAGFSFAQNAIDNTAGQLLSGGAAVPPAMSPMGSNLLYASAWFSLKPSGTWQAGDAMTIDSAFYPPSGDFLLIHNSDGSNVVPIFKGAKLASFNDVPVGDGSTLPKTFALSQNFPNPFNPSTKFTYSVPKRAEVSLEIYNVLGQKVKTLVNGTRDAQTYEVSWEGDNDNGSKVASGVYFYKLVSGDVTLTRKMMLMK